MFWQHQTPSLAQGFWWKLAILSCADFYDGAVFQVPTHLKPTFAIVLHISSSPLCPLELYRIELLMFCSKYNCWCYLESKIVEYEADI